MLMTRKTKAGQCSILVAYKGCVEMCAFLLDRGADIDDKVIMIKPRSGTQKMLGTMRIWSCAHCFRIVVQTDVKNFEVRVKGTELIPKTKLENPN